MNQAIGVSRMLKRKCKKKENKDITCLTKKLHKSKECREFHISGLILPAKIIKTP